MHDNDASTTLPTIFVCTPTHDGRLCEGWVAGALQTLLAFPGRTMFETKRGSILPQSRDVLTEKFLDSGCSHMLCVDADVGWSPDALAMLLATGKGFVSGVYARKAADRLPPILLDGRVEGDLLGGTRGVPGGFLLLARDVVDRMKAQYAAELTYHSELLGRPVVALWQMSFENGRYDGEDFSFCRRWVNMGGDIWVHPGAVVDHVGDHTYRPAPDWVARRMPAPVAVAAE